MSVHVVKAPPVCYSDGNVADRGQPEPDPCGAGVSTTFLPLVTSAMLISAAVRDEHHCNSRCVPY